MGITGPGVTGLARQLSSSNIVYLNSSSLKRSFTKYSEYRPSMIGSFGSFTS